MTTQEILEKKLGNRLFFNEPLKRNTTFKIGGPARFFYLATTSEELVEAVWLARNIKIPYFVLGGGSNILFSDEGFWGLVIKNQFSSIDIQEIIGTGARLRASAGTSTALVLRRALESNWTGLEFLDGIPGTIGGAVVVNAHSYFLGSFYDAPQTIHERIHSIDVLTPEGVLETVFPQRYVWRMNGSNITDTKDIVVSVSLDVKKNVSLEARRYLEEYGEFRRDKPYTRFPTAGSIFQNYLLTANDDVSKWPVNMKDIERVQKQIQKGIVPTGWAIDVCGLLGYKIGDAQIFPQHGNFIVNLGKATASQVLNLIDLCKKTVYDKLGLHLKEEVRIIK